MGKINKREALLEINLHELDKEWVEQPKLYFRYARKLADLRQKLEEAKAALELECADLDAAIRASPKKYGLDAERITEKMVSNALAAQESYSDAVTAVNTAKHDVNVAEAFVTALEHRKRALEKAVDLFAMDYFSVPRAKGERGREAKHKLEKQAARSSYRRNDD